MKKFLVTAFAAVALVGSLTACGPYTKYVGRCTIHPNPQFQIVVYEYKKSYGNGAKATNYLAQTCKAAANLAK